MVAFYQSASSCDIVVTYVLKSPLLDFISAVLHFDRNKHLITVLG